MINYNSKVFGNKLVANSFTVFYVCPHKPSKGEMWVDVATDEVTEMSVQTTHTVYSVDVVHCPACCGSHTVEVMK